jgi:ribulose-phosphate 3-epimerase
VTVRINPSILAADFANLQTAIESIATADLVHVDIMDGHFVPNLTFGLQMVKRLGEVASIPLDVHLMIDNPDEIAADYAVGGVDIVTFHVEASTDVVGTARRLRDAGIKAGIALKPATDPAPWLDSLDEFDQVLIMTVEPGAGGQPFMESMMPKLARVASAAALVRPDLWVQVDGGIDVETIVPAAANGANTFVAGSSIFRSDDRAERIAALRLIANR